MKLFGLLYWWKVFKRAIILIGILLSFFAVIEVLQAYIVLREINVYLGYGFALVLAVVIPFVVIWGVWVILSRPPVLIPPDVSLEKASLNEIKNYIKYLLKFMDRLAINPNLSESDLLTAKDDCFEFERMTDSCSQPEGLKEAIVKFEDSTIKSLLEKIDARAKTEVNNCIRDVMLGVALSPYRAADLMIVLYKNGAMIMRIIHLYNARPCLREMGLIFRDTMSVVAAVNYLNFGEKFMENLFSEIPFVGKGIDDAIQGIGAGFLTSIAGHAATERCRAFRGWDNIDAKERIRSQIIVFLQDIKMIFEDSLSPRLHKLFPRVPNWGEVMGAFSFAFEKSSEMIHEYVNVPLRSPSTSVAKDGEAISGWVSRRALKTGSVLKKTMTDALISSIQLIKKTEQTIKSAGQDAKEKGVSKFYKTYDSALKIKESVKTLFKRKKSGH